MSLDLNKKIEKVGLELKKKGVSTLPPIRVFAALDISGSMTNEYEDGDVQSAFDQCLGVAGAIDDDGDIDVWAFDTRSYKAPTATKADYGTYIGTRKGQGKFGHWPYGGTNYAPVLEDMVKFGFPWGGGGIKSLFGMGKKAPQGAPVMILFFTDGDPNDGNAAEAVIKRCSDDRTNVYFNLVGVGNDSQFRLLKSLADKYDNCGFTHLTSVRLPDDKVYASLINDEFVGFIKGQGVPA